VNRAWREILGYTQDEIKELTLFDIVDKSCRDKCRDNFSGLKRGEKPDCRGTGIFLTKNGRKTLVEGRCNIILQDGKAVAMVGIFRRITPRNRTENALLPAYEKIKHEVAVRKQKLAEANIALTVMLERYELNKKQLEYQILKNLSEKVSPIIERLKKSGLRDSQKNYIEIIETGMREILSPCGPGIGLTLARLTSTERTVANLVKQGKTTKEIAAFLQVAKGTVNKHRENIRKKIGITNKKQHLEKTLLAIT
jgi:PAS domain S-box-containing protein